jgi:hypothetical protein
MPKGGPKKRVTAGDLEHRVAAVSKAGDINTINSAVSLFPIPLDPRARTGSGSTPGSPIVPVVVSHI